MSNLYKKAMQDVRMPDEERILERIIKEGGKIHKRKHRPGLTAALAIACVLALAFAIPQSRAQIVAAANRIITVLKMDSGAEIVLESEPEMTAVRVPRNEFAEDKWFTVRDGRILFTGDGKETDITEECSETDYFSYSFADNSGNVHHIFVGGEVEKAGWVELIFSPEGKYLTNIMHVPSDGGPESLSAWHYRAMASMGVPTRFSFSDPQSD